MMHIRWLLFWNGVFFLSPVTKRVFSSRLLKNEWFIMANGYRSMGNLLRSISEAESPEECSMWCHSTEAQCTAFNFNAGHCELLSEVHTEMEATDWRSGRGKIR